MFVLRIDVLCKQRMNRPYQFLHGGGGKFPLKMSIQWYAPVSPRHGEIPIFLAGVDLGDTIQRTPDEYAHVIVLINAPSEKEG